MMTEISNQNLTVRSPDGVEWAPQDVKCPVCSADNFSIIGKRGGDYHRANLGVESLVVQCRECDLYYTNPTLFPLSNPYAVVEDYFINHDPKWKIEYGGELIERVEKLLGCRGRVIEPACGTGDFLLGAEKKGWKVRGVEMTEIFAAKGRNKGLDIELSSVETSKYLEEEYEAIFMLAMLEHLYDPMAMLRRANKALVSGGIAVINVPNEVTSVVSRAGNVYVKVAYGKDWTMSLSPTFSPFHVVGFSPNSLENALNRTGFDVVSLETVSGVNGLPVNGSKQKFESFGLSITLMMGKIADKFRLGNEIWCWARKR